MSIISISQNSKLNYPEPGTYSPTTIFPEYPFKNFPTGENKIYQLVRDCFHQMELDSQNYDTPAWNPLGRWIKKGSRVFILPNLVAHRRPEESSTDFLGKCTNGSVLRPLLDYIFKAVGDINLISFGNAPLQSCDYDKVAKETGVDEVTKFYQQAVGGHLIGPYDLRGVVSRWTRLGACLEISEQNLTEQIAINLGKDSFLEELYQSLQGPMQIRVGDYNPQETMSYHGPGKHVYVINKRLLEADVIISLPKLKTHQKVGLTCALKGTVGTIARKECLAHHRKGGPAQYGDEYPNSSWLRVLTSDLIDKASQSKNNWFGNMLRLISKSLAYCLRQGDKGIMGGAWYGNDTAWRMTLDIARILRYARRDGSLSEKPQREHLALVDGIIAGDGEGPLIPQAKHMGLILFGSDVCWVDYACALVMGFDPLKIPLIRNSLKEMRYPLTNDSLSTIQFVWNHSAISPDDFKIAATGCFRPPKGWVGHIETEVCHG